jgi:hypothetical protein
MKRLALVLLLISSPAYAGHDGAQGDWEMYLRECKRQPLQSMCLYGLGSEEFMKAKDRRAHPRSIDEYRKLVPEPRDKRGLCRAAGHIKQCLEAMHDTGTSEED